MEGSEGEESGEPLIAWCCLGAVGGGWWQQTRWRSGWKEKRPGRRGQLCFSLSPSRTLWDSNDGVWEVCGWGCGAVTSPCEPTPNPCIALFLHTHSVVGDLCTCFEKGGDIQAGPLRRVCPAGQSIRCSFGCLCILLVAYMWEFAMFL